MQTFSDAVKHPLAWQKSSQLLQYRSALHPSQLSLEEYEEVLSSRTYRRVCGFHDKRADAPADFDHTARDPNETRDAAAHSDAAARHTRDGRKRFARRR
jgi:hypothetical protein